MEVILLVLLVFSIPFQPNFARVQTQDCEHAFLTYDKGLFCFQPPQDEQKRRARLLALGDDEGAFLWAISSYIIPSILIN